MLTYYCRYTYDNGNTYQINKYGTWNVSPPCCFIKVHINSLQLKVAFSTILRNMSQGGELFINPRIIQKWALRTRNMNQKTYRVMETLHLLYPSGQLRVHHTQPAVNTSFCTLRIQFENKYEGKKKSASSSHLPKLGTDLVAALTSLETNKNQG